MDKGLSAAQPSGSWSWTDDLLPELDTKKEDGTEHHKQEPAVSSTSSTSWSSSTDYSPRPSARQAAKETGPASSSRTTNATNDEPPRPRTRTHWRPRTCRICLDTVNPTFHPPSEHLPGMFQGGPSVTYDSDGGRLIRPCKCKGSSRYVHENCLQQWRHADPSYGRRNFWNCPTCGFKYRLERMQWGHWISSKVTQILLTFVIFMTAVFALGFIADPIINLYLDPYGTVSSLPTASNNAFDEIHFVDEEDASWTDHFAKGLASLGLLGFVKVIFTLGPWQWWHMSRSGLMGGSGRGGTGRDRVANISWIVVVLGICTFLYTVWKGVRAWSRRVLEKASERVMDVQGDDDVDEDDDDDETFSAPHSTAPSS